jgi:hypothetical protein
VSTKATLGLVLSGGGARGIAHVGVIDALRSHGLERDVIAGSSSGAIIGALAAAGHPTETMLEFFRKASPFRLSVVTVSKPGILDTAKVVASFREYFPEDSFEALKIRLFVTATGYQAPPRDLRGGPARHAGRDGIDPAGDRRRRLARQPTCRLRTDQMKPSYQKCISETVRKTAPAARRPPSSGMLTP